jgi:hypothetical protein
MTIGMMTPINGDLVVSHRPADWPVRGAGKFVVKMHADTGEGQEYDSYDAAVAAANQSALAAVVNVFYWELPNEPMLVKQYRAI